jgi:predicted methyltransferase
LAVTFHPSRRAVLLGAAGLAWPSLAGAAETLAAAIASPLRSPANVARDRYRHPAALLAFFGLQAGQSVVEIEPGGGYWTEILAPYLQASGTYRVAIPLPAGTKAWTKFLAKLRANPASYGNVIVTGLAAPLAPPGSVDLVLSFRNLHDWLADGTTAAKLAAIHAALKPGGVFGIEDHRGIPTEPQDPRAKNGYVRQDYARALIEQAGFRFTAQSQIGDNPRDTKNYPKGVWTLPPVLAMGQTDRAQYLAIGESDRWTMKFIKPS